MQHLQQIDEQPLLLTMKQVTQRLQLGRHKIYDLIINKGLPVQRFGRAIRFNQEELLVWLEARDQQN
ncbi:helix-turn-helix domain-containing protein [Dictyobacter alpinus]|nr:helix-turn-helix domain-containing protein [Dictyobacter alpinus]